MTYVIRWCATCHMYVRVNTSADGNDSTELHWIERITDDHCIHNDISERRIRALLSKRS